MTEKLDGTIIQEVSSYIAGSGEVALPKEVVEKAKHHILDTLAAIVCGSQLKAGLQARKYTEEQGGATQAQVPGSSIVTSAVNAALAMGFMAHADETDDSHANAGIHPGAPIVSASLAVADRGEADGMRLLRGVVAGYDIACRMTPALGVETIRNRAQALHGIAGCWGAAAASASIMGLKERHVRFVLDYAGQQASGQWYYIKDLEHLEKAFVFGAMPARNGVTAALLVESGFTGVEDIFSGAMNYFQTFAPGVRPELLTEGLGSRHEVMFTDIKKYSVGSPIQAVLDALFLLKQKYGLTPQNVRSIVARIPDDRMAAVQDRDMPDVNLPYCLAVALMDGELTFAAAHSFTRMKEPAVRELKKRITLLGDAGLRTAKIKRGGIVEVVTTDGTTLREHVEIVRGRPGNPMTREEMEKKCRDLMKPVLGEDRTACLIDRIWNLEKVKNVRELRTLLATEDV